MALDTDEIVVGADGALYAAPVGTVGPTDVVTALPATWVHTGYATEDGVEITPGMDITDIMGWQSLYALRRIVGSRTLEIGLTLLQWNADTLKLAFGGGEVTTLTGVHTYTPPPAQQIDYRALIVEWFDGDKGYRLHIPKALVTETGAMNLTRTDAAGIELTFALQATDGVTPFSLVTDDPAFAA